MANDILLFADDTGANVLTQVAYAADTQRTLGNQAGIARSAFVNKVLRQTSFMSVALAQLIVDRTTQSVLDDGDDAVLLANMKNATDVAFNTNAATAKTTPVNADSFGIVDSAASFGLKKLTWADIKATILSSFGVMISTATAKTVPVDADIFIIGDSAATNASKKLTWANIKTALVSLFAPINSPAFTGTPTAPTATVGTDTTQIATTAFVLANSSVGITLGIAVASTGGTSIDFTGIPVGTKRITVMFNGVSTNGGSFIRLQLGISTGVEVLGYIGASTTSTSSSATISFTAGFDVSETVSAASTRSGVFTFSYMGNNIWSLSGGFGFSDTARTSIIFGVKTLAGILDRIRITTINGTDTFDAGSINIMYER